MTRPIVIAHRGASGHRPEHTLASYELAIDQGADFIEPDLVSTKDGVLVARHENVLATIDPLSRDIVEATTDVADHPEFADRLTMKSVDQMSLIGWFTEDFTLAELKTLRARERLPRLRPRNTAYDGLYEIPTFQEILDLVKRKGAVTGIYPETKHPTYFRSIGLPLEEPLLKILQANGYRGAEAPIFIQSFETANLKKLRSMTEIRLIQLLSDEGQPYDFILEGDPRTYAALATGKALKEIARYADGIGPHKDFIIPRDPSGHLASPTDLVEDAHSAGLLVHGWTFRNENYFLPKEHRRGESPIAHGDAAAEYRRFLAAGVDGMFSDFPDAAVAAIA